MDKQTLIDEAISLPVEDRALVVDSILRSLNPTDSTIDREWTQVAQQRLDDLCSGKITAVPAQEVFQRVRERLAQ
ncbi:MAG: addiction module protein [Spirochaetaceae bacterium]|nr:MAG: addiction module protein [Spirochaetaceae bacterium]